MYLLFAGSNYYPSGGWDDFRGEFNTLEEAREAAESSNFSFSKYDWWHVVYNNEVVAYK